MKLYITVVISVVIFLILLAASQILVSAKDDLSVVIGFSILGLMPVYGWFAGKHIGELIRNKLTS